MKKIEEEKIAGLIQEIPSWIYIEERKAIQREMRFSDFASCFAFMTRLAFLAESMNHHPEFFQCYNQLRIVLTTHDVDGLSDLDLRMAKIIDQMSPA